MVVLQPIAFKTSIKSLYNILCQLKLACLEKHKCRQDHDVCGSVIPLYTGGLFLFYTLEESICHYRGVRVYYDVLF